jgi:hypothetical protein
VKTWIVESDTAPELPGDASIKLVEGCSKCVWATDKDKDDNIYCHKLEMLLHCEFFCKLYRGKSKAEE